MSNLLDTVRLISESLNVPILVEENFLTQRSEIYYVYDFKEKSTLNQFNEINGKNITDMVHKVSISGYDRNAFELKMADLNVDNITFSHDKYFVINSIKR